MPLIARLAMLFAGGAIAGGFIPLSRHFLPLLLLVTSAGFIFAYRRRSESSWLLAFAVFGLSVGAANAVTQRGYCLPIADRARIDASGVLETQPSETQRSVQLRVPGFCTGLLRVRVPESTAALRMGDEVRVRGEWMTLRITQDRRPSSEGMVIASSVKRLPPRHANPLLRARGRTQERIHVLFPRAYPLAEALLIAQRENLNPQLRESFAASGLTHLLAISGSHVAIVAATLLLLARLLRLGRRASSLVPMVGSAAYVFFLGAPFAALRALIQMAMLLASRLLQRPAHPIGLLAAAALVITAIDPAAPLDAGFQLSFAGICGIILWRRPLIDVMPQSIPTPVRDAIATTCAATAITTPIAALHFGTVSIIALVANLFAGPLVSLAVPTTAAALALGTISMRAAHFIAGGAELTLLWLNAIAAKCAGVPGGHFLTTPAAVIASTAAVAIAFLLIRQRRHSTLRGRTAIAALAAAFPLILMPVLKADDSLEIHMIDVGQGDAIAIRSPRGRWLLVDAGPVSGHFDAGKQQVVPFLLDHQAGQLAAVILSHPHLDHFGGLPAVEQRIRVGAIMDPGMPVPGAPYDSLLAGTARAGIPWLLARDGAALNLDGVAIRFLTPDTVPLDAHADPNEFSASFRLSWRHFSALFLGDMPVPVERALVKRWGDSMDIDVLKVAHHGSGGSSSAELLEAASPAVALISAGRRNRYHHPHAKALARLEASGARIFRTDRDGSVSVRIDAAGRMTVRTRQ